MLVIGHLIVFFSTIGGFMMTGGHPAVLMHLSEFVIIGDVAIGMLVVATPAKVMKDLIQKVRIALRAAPVNKKNYLELLSALYALFMVARRDGMIALV